MEYVLGVDAGGTKFLARACDLQGNMLAEHTVRGCVYRPGNLEESRQEIRNIFDSLLSKFNGRPEDCRYLVVGSFGVDSPELQKIIDDMYRNIYPCPFLTINDAEIALYAATGGTGALVIGGTGAIATGCNSNGETTRSGGWGVNLHSDLGSGTDISLWALHYVSLYYDKLIPISPLIRMLIEECGVTIHRLMELSLQFGADRSALPGIPALVDRAYAAGDEHAKKILEDAANHLAWLGETIVAKLHLDKEPTFKMAVWGSVILKSPYIFPMIKKRWEEKYSNVDVVYPTADAAAGAIQMALEMLQNKVDHSSKRYHVTED